MKNLSHKQTLYIFKSTITIHSSSITKGFPCKKHKYITKHGNQEHTGWVALGEHLIKLQSQI